MRDYVIGNSRNITGDRLGLDWVSRLSTLSLSSAQPIDWHAHDSLEILICHRGAPLYDFGNRPAETLHSGCFLVVEPHLRHRIHDGIDAPVWRSSIFLRPPNARGRNAFFSRREYRILFDALLERRLAPRRLPFVHERDMQRLSALIQQEDGLSEMERLELRALVVSTVIRLASSPRASHAPTDNNIIDEAKSWLEDRLDKDIRLDELVDHIGYGRSRFFALFREDTGLTPLKWITRQRIEKAKRLLSDKSKTVAAVARAVGFPSPNFFAKTFRAHTGMTPQDWRRRGIHLV